jgi:hypothetical protein
MERQVVLAQRADWSLAREQPSKVGADVGGTIPVPVQWHELAVPLCATPQSANLPPPLIKAYWRHKVGIVRVSASRA